MTLYCLNYYNRVTHYKTEVCFEVFFEGTLFLKQTKGDPNSPLSENRLSNSALLTHSFHPIVLKSTQSK